MRFCFHRKQEPRWIDAPDFAWVPDDPFELAPSNDSGTNEAAQETPSVDDLDDLSPGDLSPGAQSPFTIREPSSRDEPLSQDTGAPSDIPPPQPLHRPAPAPRPARILLWARMAIGLAQGLGLYLLLNSREAGAMPGADPYLFSALSLAGLLAPLVLLEGLGEIAAILLLPWSGIVAAGLAGLGLYHHWRIQAPQQGHSGFALILLCAVLLFIAQALMRTWLAERGARRPYRIAFEAAWSLAARLCIWAAITGTAWAFLGTGSSLVNWLRPQGLELSFDPALLTMPLVGLASAFALHITAGRALAMRQVRSLLMALAAVSLPLMVGVGTALLIVHLTRAPVPAAMLLGCAAALVIAVNASWRGHCARGRRRHWPQFAAAFLILLLTAMAAAALSARIGQYGWTAARIYGGAAATALACYGILYGGAALVSAVDGRWRQRIEPANFIMALALVAGCIALASPLADPARLAVQAQAQRLKDGAVAPGAFDFTWLRRHGLRFGHDTLADMTQGRAADFSTEAARDAAITLSTAPGTHAPAPTQIGANITVRTPGARLPAALLAQDWPDSGASSGASVPPCLTKAAMACDAWFMDLDGDGTNEILLVYGNDAHWWASVMKQRGGNWQPAATLSSPPCAAGPSLAAMRAGEVTPLPGWRDLWVAGQRLHLTPEPVPEIGCAAP